MNSNALKKNPDAMNESWIDWANLILGTLLFVSPWLGFGGSGAVAANAVVCGLVIACTAGVALARPSPVAEKTNAWLGVWLLAAPWILGFSGNPAATWASLLVGFSVACFAGIQSTRLGRSARR